MPLRGRTFRIFVSSTFSDLVAERNALQKRVWPKLRDLCMGHGCRFQAIDLRWGVSEEAALDQQTMNICLREIRRCRQVTPRPNFVVLLGQRYGWRPVPPQIEAGEFDRILAYVSPDDRNRLARWYRLDENAAPPEYVLRPREPGGPFEDADAWQAEERELHRILLDAARQAGITDDALIKYERSATEQEIREGALTARTNHAFCYLRTIEGEAGTDYVEPDAEGRRLHGQLKDELRDHFPADQVHDLTARWEGDGLTDDHLAELCARVEADLSAAILEEIGALESQDALEAEIEAHEEFAEERARHFIGRRDILGRIRDYVQAAEPRPLVVCGPGGSGKSALMAKAIADLGLRIADSDDNVAIVHRFIGATPDSTDLRSLLESLCRQIHTELGYGELELRELDTVEGSGEEAEQERRQIRAKYEIPTDLEPLRRTFVRFLKIAPAGVRLTFFLDALDQLSPTDNAHTLNWLPAELPEHVRIVATVLEGEDEEAGACLRAARARFPQESVVHLEPLTPEDGGVILDIWLQEAGRTLTDEQREDVLGKFAREGLPLYLKVAFEEARRWHSYDGLPCGADEVPGLYDTVEGVIRDMLARLEDPRNHGKVLVSKALGYLAAARHGLTEDELLDVLSADEDVKRAFQARSRYWPEAETLPVVLWSRLSFDLAPYLTERSADEASLLSFYHRQFADVVAGEFLGEGVRRDLHAALADYFQRQPIWLEDPEEERRPNHRKASALPYQQTLAEMWRELAGCLCNLDFIEAKCKAGMTYDLVNDYQRLRLGRAAPGPPILTARRHGGRYGAQCPFCLAWSEVVAAELGRQMDCPHCRNALTMNPFSVHAVWEPCGATRAVAAIQRTTPPELPPALGEFGDFVRREAHVLARYPQLASAQAGNWPDGSAPNLAAESRRRSGGETRPWLRWVNKPQRQDPCLATLAGHTNGVMDCAFSPDGQRILSGSLDNTFRIWDAETGSELSMLAWHAEAAASAQVLLRGDNDWVRMLAWHAEAAASAHRPISPDQLTACAFSADGRRIASCSWDGTIRLWDAATGTELLAFSGHSDSIAACALGPGGRQVVSGSADGEIKLWDAGGGAPRATVAAHADCVHCLAVGPDGRLVASASADETLKLWDAETGAELSTLAGHSSRAKACAFSPDGRRLVSGSVDGTLKLWDVETGAETTTLAGHSGWVMACAFSPDGRQIVSGSSDRTLKLWDAETGGEVGMFVGHFASVTACAFGPDARRIVSGSTDNTLRLWDAGAAADSVQPGGHTREVVACAFTPDGRGIVSASRDKTLRLWDAQTGSGRGTLLTDNGGFLDFALSPEGRRVLTTSSLYTSLGLWDVGSGSQIATIPGPIGRVFACAFSPDGRAILDGGGNGFTLTLRRADTRGRLGTFGPHERQVRACAFSPDGRRVLSASEDGTLKLWDAETGTQLATLAGHSSRVEACAFSPDGRRIVSASADRTLKLWDADDGDQLTTFAGHAAGVLACAFSPDGRHVVSGSEDSTLRLWDAETGAQLAALAGPVEALRCCAFGPDGRRIALGDATGAVLVLQPVGIAFGPPIVTAWQSGVGDLPALGCPRCRAWSEVPEGVLRTEVPCPNCGEMVKLNRFVIEADWRPVAAAWRGEPGEDEPPARPKRWWHFWRR